MAMTKAEAKNLLAVRKDENGEFVGAKLFRSHEAAELWLDKKSRKTESVHLDEVENPEKIEDPFAKKYSEMIKRYSDVSKRHRSMIHMTSVLQILPNAEVDRNIFSLAKRADRIVSDSDKGSIVEIDLKETLEVERSFRSANRNQEAFQNLPAATIILLTSNFESILAEIVEETIMLRKEIVFTKDKKMSASEILNCSSVDELISRFIKDEVYEFMRGSKAEQIKFISEKLNVDIASAWERWPIFVEVFERRNLLAHGEKKFTARYERACRQIGDCNTIGTVGTSIELDRSYIEAAADTLDEFLILLIFRLWIKNSKKTIELAIEDINDCAYKAIFTSRYELAARLLDFALKVCGSSCGDRIRRMMVVNQANSHKLAGKPELAESVLSSHDWSATSDDFKISIAAIRGDTEQVVSLMPRVTADELVGKIGFRSWPVFRDQRKLPEFRAKFEEIFGEPLSREELVIKRSVEAEADDDAASSDRAAVTGTFH